MRRLIMKICSMEPRSSKLNVRIIQLKHLNMQIYSFIHCGNLWWRSFEVNTQERSRPSSGLKGQSWVIIIGIYYIYTYSYVHTYIYTIIHIYEYVHCVSTRTYASNVYWPITVDRPAWSRFVFEVPSADASCIRH